MTEPKTVPKFGSFRPRPPSTPNAPSSLEPATNDTRNREHRHHQRHQSQSKERTRSKISDIAPSHAPDDIPDIFIIDRKGDEKNLVYGSIHKYSIPTFRRFGAGYVLGLSSDFRIDRDYGDDKGTLNIPFALAHSHRVDPTFMLI